MTRRNYKDASIGLMVLCLMLTFVAIERYQANVAQTEAANQLIQNGPFGQNGMFGQNRPLGAVPMLNGGHSSGLGVPPLKPGVPAITTYAILFAIMSAGGAVVCYRRANEPALAV